MPENHWPSLDSFCMLLASNNRSKAYLQNLIKENFKPNKVVLMDTGSIKLPEHTESDAVFLAPTSQRLIRNCPITQISFDENESVETTLKEHAIPYVKVFTRDVNSKEVILAIKDCPDRYLVYSGPGGQLLRSELLSLGKHILHAHPGLLPDFRGSTVIYYSILATGEVGCSVIELTEQIDCGALFYQCHFKVQDTVSDYDYILDPAIRTRALLNFFNINYKKPLQRQKSPESSLTGNTYYIIHPLLKHLAILSKVKEPC